jgi:hypothetical protein
MNTEIQRPTIPYEQQRDPANVRMCGAACLNMVYRSLGKDVPQTAIWQAVAAKNHFGSLAASTHLMTKDALQRGFHAVAVQTTSPIEALRNCYSAGIPAIINHLLEPNRPAGHYSVLTRIDDQFVYLHDPFFGPDRRLSYADLLMLWSPQAQPSEISGFVLIAVTGKPSEKSTGVQCPECGGAVLLPPPELLAGVNICPACDHTWAVDDKPEQPVKKCDLRKVFADMDRFTSFVLSLPAAAEHPDIRAQINALAQQKEKILGVVKSFEASQLVRNKQIAAIEKAAEEGKAAHDKKMAQLAVPMEQLDGRVLGLELLKSLGYRQIS